jgi:long-chain acyl-CoA synthetase
MRYPEKTAIVTHGTDVTYAGLSEQSDRVASALAELGLRRGERAVLLLENSPTFAAVYFGILKAGGIAVPLHAGADTDTVAAVLAHAAPKAAILPPEKAGTFDTAVRMTGTRLVRIADDTPRASGNGAGTIHAGTREPGTETHLPDRPGENPAENGREHGAISLLELLRAAGPPPEVRMIDLDLESIVYTSGSTGEPKGVMLSHLNTVSNMRSIVQYFRLTPDDRIMVILPFSYIYGKSLLLTHIMAGGSAALGRSFIFPNSVLDDMNRFEVTGFAGVPSTFSILLSRSKLREMTFPTLRYMCQAGGGMAPALQKELMEAIAPAKLYVMYGATEAAPRLTYLEPDRLPDKLGSIGKAIPNVEVFVADETGRRLPPGEEGEIVARGSNIMCGYWKDPAHTAEVLRDGLYFTGDLGREDEEGFLFVTGRKRDFIKVKGHRVSAKEIEDALLSLEPVQEAAVAGMPDSILGEAARAWVVLKPGGSATEDGLRAELAARLAPHKIPDRILFRDALPKNEAGKILKAALVRETLDGLTDTARPRAEPGATTTPSRDAAPPRG